MKKIIIRAGISPIDTFDAAHMIVHNSIGGNVGNLLYQYGVFRTLMTEGKNITPDYYHYKPENADAINEKYDCYVLPLADAFRNEFVPSLRKYTKLIKKLKIPVVIIGVGLRAPFEPKLNEGFPFDADVKAFIEAVLEKSSIVGVRGEITSQYLSRLGFREGVDHTVIGCPSMYTFGRELKIRDTTITKDSIISVNSSLLSPKNVLGFISKSMEEYPNHYFIPQWLKEMKLVYAGFPSLSQSNNHYPANISDPVYINNRVRYFLNVPTWLDFLRSADLSFGARLHGNIAATLAGTPSIIIPKDARMRELVEYHHLTHIMADKITDSTTLSEVIEKCDFQQPAKKQGENFDHFIHFLNKNNLDHIYKDSVTPARVPLDEKLLTAGLKQPLSPISSCNMTEMAQRWDTIYALEEEKNAKARKNQKDKLEKSDKKIKEMKISLADKEKIIKNQKAKLLQNEKSIKKLQGTLNRKSVRLALKAADMISFK